MQVPSATQQLAATSAVPPPRRPRQTLDYNAFLQLLIAQMKNQDPTKPMDSAQYMAQLASFSERRAGDQDQRQARCPDDVLRADPGRRPHRPHRHFGGRHHHRQDRGRQGHLGRAGGDPGQRRGAPARRRHHDHLSHEPGRRPRHRPVRALDRDRRLRPRGRGGDGDRHRHRAAAGADAGAGDHADLHPEDHRHPARLRRSPRRSSARSSTPSPSRSTPASRSASEAGRRSLSRHPRARFCASLGQHRAREPMAALRSLPASSRSSARGGQDVGFAVGIVFILTVLFLPLPAVLIDIGLAFSIALSVLILMVALWIQKPLDFSAFPTVLLIATLLRLALNIATTRLILSNGAEGYAAAGHVIAGFANFVMSGDFVIGTIVFVILITVNFLVITKGATRIAEVGARFTLDAIPGKQMAIDADLNAGADRREGGDAAPARAGGGKRLLRLHGRRLQVRARRRHRRPHHHRRQRLRRHRHRRHPPRHVAGGSRRRLHQALGRRRSRHADPGADRLAGRRPAGLEGRHARLGREGGVRPARQLSRAPCCWPASSCSCWRSRRACRSCPSRCSARLCASSPTPSPSAAPRCVRPRRPRSQRGGARSRGGGAPLGQGVAQDRRDRALPRQADLDVAAQVARRAGPARRQDAPQVRQPVRLRRARDQAHRRPRHPAQDLPDQDPRHGGRQRGAAHRRRARHHRRRAASPTCPARRRASRPSA